MLLVASCWAPCDGPFIPPGGGVILLVDSCHRNQLKFREYGSPLARVRLHLICVLSGQNQPSDPTDREASRVLHVPTHCV